MSTDDSRYIPYHERVSHRTATRFVGHDDLHRPSSFLAALMHPFHLRDRLQETRAGSRRKLKKFFDASEEMRLCRSLANSLKHSSVKPDPRRDEWPNMLY